MQVSKKMQYLNLRRVVKHVEILYDPDPRTSSVPGDQVPPLSLMRLLLLSTHSPPSTLSFHCLLATSSVPGDQVPPLSLISSASPPLPHAL